MLCSYISPGSFLANMNTISFEASQLFEQLSIKNRLPTLTRGMFARTKANQFPCLKGRGSCIKDFGIVLGKFFEQHMRDRREGDHRGTVVAAKESVRRWVLWSLQVSNKLNRTLDNHSHDAALPESVAVKFEADTFRLCGLVTLLGEAFHPAGVALYNYTIKWHYLLHVGLIARYQNPMMGACFQGKQMMRIVEKLVASCARNNTTHTEPQILRWSSIADPWALR